MLDRFERGESESLRTSAKVTKTAAARLPGQSSGIVSRGSSQAASLRPDVAAPAACSSMNLAMRSATASASVMGPM